LLHANGLGSGYLLAAQSSHRQWSGALPGRGAGRVVGHLATGRSWHWLGLRDGQTAGAWRTGLILLRLWTLATGSGLNLGLGLGQTLALILRKVLGHQHKVIGVLVGAARSGVVLAVAQHTHVGDGGTNGRICHYGH